jgi:ketosteroid isomerase-like protein
MQTRLCFSLWLVLAAPVLLWAGCVSTKQASSAVSDAEQAPVKERLAEIFHAAETKDLARLDSYHWYGPHFTKFAGTGKRMDAAAAREGEHTGLSALAGLKLRAEDLQVDVFSDTAVATFIATASFQAGADTVTKRERGTLVLIKRSGSWRIVHEHFSAAE